MQSCVSMQISNRNRIEIKTDARSSRGRQAPVICQWFHLELSSFQGHFLKNGKPNIMKFMILPILALRVQREKAGTIWLWASWLRCWGGCCGGWNENSELSTWCMWGALFVAADGDCIKASMKYFEDTGLMAILCHHDRPLFLANLWTTGEKHFCMLALIATVFAHLPPHWHIGILYDILCQLHHSLNKHDYGMDWLSHIIFGVSVFHTYGHQWSCQLWYHPRKSDIWGLSDGKGCKWFWSELRKLIPNLCVTGVSSFYIQCAIKNLTPYYAIVLSSIVPPGSPGWAKWQSEEVEDDEVAINSSCPSTQEIRECRDRVGWCSIWSVTHQFD